MTQDPFAELRERYKQARLNFKFHGFLLTGLALVGIGVSQIIYGWAGDGFVPKYLYPVGCFLMGGGIVAFWGWVVRTIGFLPVMSDSDLKRLVQAGNQERVWEVLRKIALRNYGEFEMTDELPADLEALEELGLVVRKRDFEEYPERGPNLCAYFDVPSAVREFFEERRQRKI